MSESTQSLLSRVAAGFRHAFALKSPHGALTEEDHELLHRLAVTIDKRGLTTPAIMFLESIGPLNYIGSQAMVFLKPIATLIFNPDEYERFTKIVERREGLSALVGAIEEVVASCTAGGDA